MIDLDTFLAGLRSEQREAVDAGVANLLRRDTLLIVSPTGTGKSYVQGAIHRLITEHHGYGNTGMYSTFPQSEIAEGVFAKTYGLPGDWAGLSAKKRQALLESFGFWTVKRLYNELNKGQIKIPTFLQHDECFPAGTVVDGRAIETFRVGDKVTSFSGARTVARVFDNLAPARMVEIRAGGRTLVATPNHPIYTPEGWKRASDITVHDLALLHLPDGIHPLSGAARERSEGAERLLQSGLYLQEVFARDGRNEPGSRLGAHEDEQPDGEAGRPGEDVCDPEGDRSQAPGAGRERARVARGGSPASGDGVDVWARHDRDVSRERSPESLQVRPVRADGKTGDRGGRTVAQRPEGPGGRPAEGGLVTFVRVDRVTVHERGGTGEYSRMCPNGRVYNLEVEGDHTYFANGLGVHNCHHSTDDTHELIHAICGLCPRLGATATDYRGTAVETAKFRARWPRQHRVLTLKNAVKLGRLSMPTWDVWPLLDDEQINVVGGEFSISSVESHLTEKLADLVDRIGVFVKDARWDRPTMIAVPGVGAVKMVVEALNLAGYPAVGVTGETSDADRAEAFRKCIGREAVLVQIRVVGEGVDLPIRRLIDLAPTVSPVLWMQRVGRITRPIGPDEAAPEYIACCHNLARHAYLWHGVMPSSAIKKATEAWGEDFKPSKRFLARAVDVEGLGRFTPAGVQLLDGSHATLYVMQTKDGLHEYAIALHPLVPDPWFFARENKYTGQKVQKTLAAGLTVEYNEKTFGKWSRVPKLPELKGCQTIKLSPLQPAQLDWWKRSAKSCGFDPDVEITNREFQVLPILMNSRTRLKVEGDDTD